MPIDPVTGQVIATGVIAASQAITRGGPRRQYKWNKKAAEDANRMNQQNADRQNAQNLAFQREQREYDSPAAQMARYKEAGLNPHLIYGSGAGASGGVFPIDAAGIAPARLDAPDASYPDIAGSYVQASQALAQTDLARSRTAESGLRQEAIEIQNAISKTNPMLSPSVAEWVRASMEETARLKALESRQWMTGAYGKETYKFQEKINAELEQMSQKIGLNSADQSIRNKILESKEFENALKEIQVKWLKDSEVTPQHIYQALLLMLSKML